jgi:hypothetical protein
MRRRRAYYYVISELAHCLANGDKTRIRRFLMAIAS